MAEKNRASLLAIVEEVTAGTIVLPSVGTQFVALQEGFSLAPNFEQIDNAEIRASIGVAKSIQGLESPSGSFDHYLRHSGVEGQAPGFGSLIKAVLGSTSSNGTERVTAGGSTVSVVALAAGGADFDRGKAILLKDGTNGYSIRPVHSRSGNDLTLGFQLSAAPAAGIGAGKCVNYAPANSGHPTLSLWLYRGNGGALEAMAGARMSSLSISIAAGELINASYAFEGTKYFFNPINITSADRYIDFTDDDGTFAASITAKTYRDPHELAQAIQDAMNTANSGETKTVVYLDASGKYKITSTGTVLELLFLTGANNANSIDTSIGFTHTDHTGTAAGTGYTSDNAVSFAATVTPSYDSADPQAAKNNEVFIGDSDDITCFCASTVDISITNEIQNVECVCAESGVQDKIFNRRIVEANIVGVLDRYDADKFKKYRANDDVRFAFNFGTKSGGNWVAGKCCNIYMPSASVSAFELGDNNGLVTMNITVRAFVDSSGNGEFYINFL
jgi:hypothetical protein